MTIGDDGLTDAERAELADQYRNGPARLRARVEMDATEERLRGFITPEELGSAVSRARAASLDDSIDLTALMARLREETGREFPSSSVRVDPNDESLPAGLREALRRTQAHGRAFVAARIAGERRTA